MEIKRNRNQRTAMTASGHTYGTPEGTFPFRYLSEKKFKTRKLERKSKQKIYRLIDLLYRLSDIISR